MHMHDGVCVGIQFVDDRLRTVLFLFFCSIRLPRYEHAFATPTNRPNISHSNCKAMDSFQLSSSTFRQPAQRFNETCLTKEIVYSPSILVDISPFHRPKTYSRTYLQRNYPPWGCLLLIFLSSHFVFVSIKKSNICTCVCIYHKIIFACRNYFH